MSKRTVVACCIGIVVALTWWLWQPQRATFTSKVPVRIAMSVTPLSAPFIIAQAKGYFVEQGLLNVTIHHVIGGFRALRAVLQGKADIATVSDLPVMFNSLTRDDFSICFTFVSSDNDVKIITRTDIGIQSIQDLSGRKVGAVLGASSQFFLESFLIYHDINPDDVDIVGISPEDMAQSLRDGNVDAVAIWEPYAFQTMQLLGQKSQAIKNPKELYKETFNAVALNEYMQKNKEIMKRVTLAIAKAINFMLDNNTEAQNIVMKLFPGKEAFIRAVWDDFRFELSLDQSLIVMLENEARWAIKHALTEKKTIPNYLQYMYFDALDAVNPTAVSIVH